MLETVQSAEVRKHFLHRDLLDRQQSGAKSRAARNTACLAAAWVPDDSSRVGELGPLSLPLPGPRLCAWLDERRGVDGAAQPVGRPPCVDRRRSARSSSRPRRSPRPRRRVAWRRIGGSCRARDSAERARASRASRPTTTRSCCASRSASTAPATGRCGRSPATRRVAPASASWTTARRRSTLSAARRPARTAPRERRAAATLAAPGSSSRSGRTASRRSGARADSFGRWSKCAQRRWPSRRQRLPQ